MHTCSMLVLFLMHSHTRAHTHTHIVKVINKENWGSFVSLDPQCQRLSSSFLFHNSHLKRDRDDNVCQRWTPERRQCKSNHITCFICFSAASCQSCQHSKYFHNFLSSECLPWLCWCFEAGHVKQEWAPSHMLLTCKPRGKPALRHVILTSLLDQQQVSRGQISRCFFHKLLQSTGESVT